MQTNRYLLTAIKIGLGIILFAPLFVSNTMFFPFITAKNFLFRIIIEILLALWVILALRDRRYMPRRSLLLIFVAASVGVLILSTIFGVDPSRSFWSNFERMEGLLGYLHLFVYFLILISVNKTEKDWWRFFHVSFLSAILVGVYALFQLGGVFQIHQGGVRIDSTLGNATYLAVYMLFHVFLSLYYFLKTKNHLSQVAYGALVIFTAFILYETATRGAILGLIGGLFLFGLIFAITSREKKWRYFAFGVLALVIAISAGVYALRDSDFIQNNPTLGRLSNISAQGDDAQARFQIWGMSFEAFKERPILGWGPENFSVVFSKYFDPRLWSREPWFDRSHNVILDWLITGGVFGLVSYLGIFATSLWLLLKKYRERKISNLELSIFTGLLAGFLFQNIFVFDQLTSYLLFFAVLGYIYFLTQGESLEKPAPLVAPGTAQVFSAVAVVAIVISLYFFNIKPLLANFSLLSALEAANAGNFQAAQTNFKRAINLSPLGRREAREQYSHFASLIAGRSDIPEAIRVSSINDGIDQSKLEAEDSALDARSHLFLGSVYNAAGRKAEALAAFEKALELSPKKQQIIFIVAQFYLDAGEKDKAVELAKMGASLDPTYNEAQHNLIMLQISAGKDQDALAAIDNLIKNGKAGAERVKVWASLFASQKKFDIAADLYKKLLEATPNDTQTRISLAASYYEAGKINLAIKEIEEAIRLNPSFKEQGEGFIKQLREGVKEVE